MKKYRGIVIGAGAIGALLESDPERPKPATHAGALLRNRKTELAAIVDADAGTLAKAKRLFPRAKTYASAAEALAAEKPDIVAIATPASSHKALIDEALSAGVKMIICEKPVAASYEEASAIRDALAKDDAAFVLNYQRRFFKLFHEVRERIKRGDLGRIQHVTCYYSNGLYNNGGHTIDALEFLLGEPIISVVGEVVAGARPDGDVNVHAMLATPSGTRMTLIPLDQDAYGIHELRIYGEKGKYALTDYGYALTMAPAAPSLFAGVQQLDYALARRKDKRESMVAGALAEAIAAHEGKRAPASGIENGLYDMRVLDAIVESAREGKIISIPE